MGKTPGIRRSAGQFFVARAVPDAGVAAVCAVLYFVIVQELIPALLDQPTREAMMPGTSSGISRAR